MTSKPGDIELIERLRRLYSGVVADALDKIKYRDQVMHRDVKPLHADMVLAGRARTAYACEIRHEPEEPWLLTRQMIDSLTPGDVVVVAVRETRDSANWGELCSTAAHAKGGHGVVLDGCLRDSRRIIELGFPAFAIGLTPADDRYRTEWVSIDQPVRCGGVEIHPGDYLLGDRDGVVIVPSAVIDDVLYLAESKLHKEDTTRSELEQGVPLRDVFQKHGVL
jgi:4-hydroxy-4-methyl-2-oxoglutarate aldolase